MEAYELKRLNILVVDNNHHMRFLLRIILQWFDIREIKEAADASAALQVLRNFPADILITDWVLDPIDGFELVQTIRTSPDSANPFLPVIMLTGHSDQISVAKARDCGANEVLAKPVSATTVYNRIVQLIEKPRAFIKTSGYTGPDRRRKVEAFGGAERRQSRQ